MAIARAVAARRLSTENARRVVAAAFAALAVYAAVGVAAIADSAAGFEGAGVIASAPMPPPDAETT